MKRFWRITLLFLMLLSLFTTETLAISWQMNLANALNNAKTSKKPIMVDFYTDWCGWCKKLDSDTYRDSKVNILAAQFICIKINADRNSDLISKYSVSGYPTIIFLSPEGSVVDTIGGYLGPKDFANVMESVLQKTKSAQPVKSESQKQQVEKKEKFALQGIVYDPKAPQVLINGKLLKVGDTVEGAKVAEINKEGVMLVSGQENIKLRFKE